MTRNTTIARPLPFQPERVVSGHGTYRIRAGGGALSRRRHLGDGQVRMLDVALRANVSQMTVSRALRSPERVSEATRRQIEAAIRETGYVPNNIASSLASNRSTTVGAIIPSITHSALEPTIESLMASVKRHGLNLMIGTSGETIAEEATMIEAMLAQRPCGLFLHNTRHAASILPALRNAGIPIVETGDLVRKPIDMCVSYSNQAAAEAMTTHLLNLGYRRIAIANVLTGSNYRSRARLKGYCTALEKAGVAVDRTLIRDSDYGFAGGAGVMRAIIAEKLDVDALFCGTGLLGLGALYECRQQGWAVPSRIAIAGFGHNEVTDSAIPSLTTVRIPRAEIGRLAADMLLSRINGQSVPAAVIDVGFEIVARDST